MIKEGFGYLLFNRYQRDDTFGGAKTRQNFP